MPEVKYRGKHEKRLKILTPKQMIQRLPISLTQYKNIKKTSDTKTINLKYQLQCGMKNLNYFEFISKKHQKVAISPLGLKSKQDIILSC